MIKIFCDYCSSDLTDLMDFTRYPMESQKGVITLGSFYIENNKHYCGEDCCDKDYYGKIEKELNKITPALIKIARRELKELQDQSDEGFLMRAEMDRKLNSL